MDANGKAYSYTVDEGNVPEGYVKSVNGTTITNTYQNSTQTSISGKKVWQDFDNQLNTVQMRSRSSYFKMVKSIKRNKFKRAKMGIGRFLFRTP
ncbi:Cna B-type domain-containing protein [Listeria aquatica]